MTKHKKEFEDSISVKYPGYFHNKITVWSSDAKSISIEFCETFCVFRISEAKKLVKILNAAIKHAEGEVNNV